MHPNSQILYRVEVSKLFGPSWLFVPVNALGVLLNSRDWSLFWSAVVQANFRGIHEIIHPVCVSLYKILEVFFPEFGIGVSNGRDVVGNNQHLFNFPRVYEIVSQPVQKLQPPRVDHVVREYEALLR